METMLQETVEFENKQETQNSNQNDVFTIDFDPIEEALRLID